MKVKKFTSFESSVYILQLINNEFVLLLNFTFYDDKLNNEEARLNIRFDLNLIVKSLIIKKNMFGDEYIFKM